MIRVELPAGKRFDRLTVIREGARRGPARERTYLCRCDCGAEKEILLARLRAGRTKSCGCLHRERIGETNAARAGEVRKKKMRGIYGG